MTRAVPSSPIAPGSLVLPAARRHWPRVRSAAAGTSASGVSASSRASAKRLANSDS
jgi:hypothetical protein